MGIWRRLLIESASQQRTARHWLLILVQIFRLVMYCRAAALILLKLESARITVSEDLELYRQLPYPTVQIQLPALANMDWNNQGYLMTYDNAKTYQQSPQLRVYSSGSNFYNYQQILNIAVNGGDATGGSVQRIYNDSLRTSSGSPPATGPFVMTDCRIVLPSGTDWDMWVFGVGLGQPRKSRICIMWDDGRESSLTLGYPTLAAFDIKKQTLALVKDRINLDAESATMGQVSSFINAGGAIVPHSPHSPNIVDQFPGDPQGAANAILDCIDYIKSLGLSTPRFERCFVYPQGKYQASVLDTSYLEAMKAIGIDIARISFMQDIRQQRNLDAHSRLGRLACATIGHQYAGSSGAETTNISTVIQRITDCATYGVDCFLMLHSVTKLANSEHNMTQTRARKYIAGDHKVLCGNCGLTLCGQKLGFSGIISCPAKPVMTSSIRS
jgi:hypothetical protein